MEDIISKLTIPLKMFVVHSNENSIMLTILTKISLRLQSVLPNNAWLNQPIHFTVIYSDAFFPIGGSVTLMMIFM